MKASSRFALVLIRAGGALLPASAQVTSIAYALGGAVLVTGGGFETGIALTDVASGGMDHMIRLWHPELDQEAVILTGHSGSILCLAFAEHGNALVSGNMDGTLKIWRALSFDQIKAQEQAAVVSRSE